MKFNEKFVESTNSTVAEFTFYMLSIKHCTEFNENILLCFCFQTINNN